jgi:hypothetical protein
MTNLYALIVGIEKYDLPNWNRSGPVAGAIEMAYWCNRIGMPFKNIHMILSINDQDPTWISGHQSTISHFKKTGATIFEDTSLNAIDTFWRNTLPTLPNVDSKLLVYWCGHGVTRPDRDRILLHTDYRPDNLPNRVTSAHNLFATLTTQAYGQLKEQLIIADVCGDFIKQPVSPNDHSITNPVNTIAQHCYFASVDGESAQIDNGIGQFTKSTLEVLKQYTQWPDLDDLKTRMDKKFRNGSSKAFKIWIRTPQEEYDEIGDKSDHAKDATKQPSSEDVKQLIRTCNEHIKRNELEDLFHALESFVHDEKNSSSSSLRNTLQILQNQFSAYKTGKMRGTLKPDPDTHRHTLIESTQDFLTTLTSDLRKTIDRSTVPQGTPKNPNDFFREHVHNLLKGNNELTRFFSEELFPKKKDIEVDPVVDHLIGPPVPTDYDYPLLRLRNLLQDLEEASKRLDPSCRLALNAVIELLSIASFPPQDRECVEVAMKEVLLSTPQSGSDFALNTTNSKDAEKLLVATRLKLTNRNINGLDFNQLLNNNYREGDRSTPMLDIIHVVPEPKNVPDNESTVDFYAKCILTDLNLEQPETAWKESLNRELTARKGRKGDGKVVAMMISQDKKTAIQVLRNSIPLLLVVVLPAKSIVRYSTVFNDRAAIEQILTRILRSPQK